MFAALVRFYGLVVMLMYIDTMFSGRSAVDRQHLAKESDSRSLSSSGETFAKLICHTQHERGKGRTDKVNRPCHLPHSENVGKQNPESETERKNIQA